MCGLIPLRRRYRLLRRQVLSPPQSSPGRGLRHNLQRLIFGERPGRRSLRSATNRSCRIHVAEAIVFCGKGRHGESHGEEKEGQEENQVLLK